MRLAKQLLGQANAALAPLGPVFNLIDVALALFNAVKAIPDAISHLDPSKITDALPELAQKAGKLLPLVPQLSVPLMIVGLIDTLLAFLGGLAGQLRALIDQQMRIQKAENRAAELGNAQLQAVADCSKPHVAAQLQSLSESVAPVNRLVALVQIGREKHDGENVLAIRIRYDAISTNTPGNNVIFSGVEQTVIVSNESS